MAKKYCASCAEITEYTLSIPKFCGGCGKEFASMFGVAPAPVKNKMVMPKRQVVEEDDYEEQEEVETRVPKSIELDIEYEEPVHKEAPKFRDVFATTKPVQPGPKKVKINKKEVLNQFLKQATPTKTAIDII